MSDTITELNADNFESFIATADTTLVVDFWAPWCGPCKAITPILEELSTELSGSVKIGKVNIDDNGALATQFEVRAIPTIKIFKNGAVVDTVVGLASKDDLKKRLA
jgi:thioredoxin 1|tara:strand:+ start:274 stop:591 length:318 start_codon:yes stop_codon:yes gene_type:complete